MFKDLIGIPFEFGKMDCEILAKEVFSRYGINLPDYGMARSAISKYIPEDISKEMKKEFVNWVPIKEPEAPCLVALGRCDYINHVGVYIGDGKFIHTTITRGAVTIERLSNPLYRNRKLYRFNSNCSD